MNVKLTLFDLNVSLCTAWEEEFENHENVVVKHAVLEEVEPHDCLVSPANSFGLMNGGIDAAISAMLPEVQSLVQEEILLQYAGEQPVGTSVIVPTTATGDLSKQHFPWLAHTPTMRFPRPISPEVVYDAMRAMLLEIRNFNATIIMNAMREADLGLEDLLEGKLEIQIDDGRLIRSVACPGLGTASGRVPPKIGARMMREAYDSIERNEPYADWTQVHEHLDPLYQGMRI